MDGHYLIAVLNNRFSHQGCIGTHAYNVLIIVVVRDAVDVHRVRERLALGRCRGGRELCSLQAVVESQYAEIHERRQDIVVNSIMKQVVELSLRQHRHFGHGNF